MRQPKPFFRKQTQSWYVQLDGKQIRLGKDESEAWKEYHRLMEGASLSSGTAVVHLLDEFLDWLKDNRSDGTYQWYRRHLRKFRQFIGDRLRVEDLKPFHLTRWLASLRVGQTTKNMAGRAVKRAFKWAASEGYISRSPVASATVPSAARRETIITPEQWQQILDAVLDEEFRDVLTVLRETGCRPTELRLVEARHLHGDRWVFERDESKGKRNRRVVYLTDDARSICERLAEIHPTGPLFRSRNGEPWRRNALTWRFKRLRVKLGIKGMTPYTIRHTFVTDALVRGVDPITLAQICGHKDGTMIARVYAHLCQKPDHLQAALRRAVGASEADSGRQGRPA